MYTFPRGACITGTSAATRFRSDRRRAPTTMTGDCENSRKHAGSCTYNKFCVVTVRSLRDRRQSITRRKRETAQSIQHFVCVYACAHPGHFSSRLLYSGNTAWWEQNIWRIRREKLWCFCSASATFSRMPSRVPCEFAATIICYFFNRTLIILLLSTLSWTRIIHH